MRAQGAQPKPTPPAVPTQDTALPAALWGHPPARSPPRAQLCSLASPTAQKCPVRTRQERGCSLTGGRIWKQVPWQAGVDPCVGRCSLGRQQQQSLPGDTPPPQPHGTRSAGWRGWAPAIEVAPRTRQDQAGPEGELGGEAWDMTVRLTGSGGARSRWGHRAPTLHSGHALWGRGETTHTHTCRNGHVAGGEGV